jgi:hypothetical protein
MRVTHFGITALFVALTVAGCCKSGEESSNPPPTTTAVAPPPPTVAVVDFSGTYSSNWGTTTFAQTGTTVTATYPRGNMNGTVTGDTLNCTWFEGASTGKARLFKMPNGDVKGTWGNGASATNGGPWLFTRKF